MSIHPDTPSSLAFEDLAGRASFRDRIALVVKASPEAVFNQLSAVTLSDMKAAWLLGELRYLPARLAGRMPQAEAQRPFFDLLIGNGTLVLHDDRPHELIVGSAGKLHRMNQDPRHFRSRAEFDAFEDPDYEKLFISIRTAPADTPGETLLILEHATEARSAAAKRGFSHYWFVIRPLGAFVSRQLLFAIRRRAEAVARQVLPSARDVRGQLTAAGGDVDAAPLPDRGGHAGVEKDALERVDVCHR